VAAGSVTNVTLRHGSRPDPLATGYATLRYSLPKSGVVMLNVYDVTGRSVITRRSTPAAPADRRSTCATLCRGLPRETVLGQLPDLAEARG